MSRNIWYIKLTNKLENNIIARFWHFLTSRASAVGFRNIIQITRSTSQVSMSAQSLQEWRFLDDYEFAVGGTMSFETHSPLY